MACLKSKIYTGRVEQKPQCLFCHGSKFMFVQSMTSSLDGFRATITSPSKNCLDNHTMRWRCKKLNYIFGSVACSLCGFIKEDKPRSQASRINNLLTWYSIFIIIKCLQIIILHPFPTKVFSHVLDERFVTINCNTVEVYDIIGTIFCNSSSNLLELLTSTYNQ